MQTVTLPHPNTLIAVEPLDYPNTYDIHTPHRHNYFELMLIETKGGHQFIDFTKHPLQAQQVFIIYPGQVHLLARENAHGIVLQFKKEIFDFLFPLKHHQFYKETPLLKVSPNCFKHLCDLSHTIGHFLKEENPSALAKEKVYSYLKIILITIIEQQGNKSISLEQQNFASTFLSLLEQHIFTKRKVTDYTKLMGLSNDKCTLLCKQTFGKTPLKLIHEELLMQIRRLLLLNQYTLKEIAFELNFDSQAHFSSFIKQVTGKTASDLQTEMLNIYQTTS
ncbi:helix-turn-helix domain-containing protein [Neptunitalea lumnitzerae]|uniref:AraC family transcriptional regulator n=1 Tax=Neptunitalea lumnitzerae TaxID=2965509 RepID=A0ABQ5MEN4_9FLAO|nr:helix-turn-helix domain-containing protein [Neptunitalea sp. Y10]GLB47849.1 AraC family transcriptional regulator [Neptunitalea sp. Y10]